MAQLKLLFASVYLLCLFPEFSSQGHMSSYRIYVPKENKFQMYRRCRYHICENPPDYPEDEISAIMSYKHSVGIFGVVLNSTYDRFKIHQRGDVTPIKQSLCRNTLRTEFAPRAMANKDGIWKTVVNVEGHRQIFSAEMCRYLARGYSPFRHRETEELDEEDSLCHYSFNYKCKQSYQNMFLLVYENGKIDFDDFFVPTMCNCASG